MERWISRVALVTGASRGIGAAICKTLVKHGINVVGCATDVRRVEELAKDVVTRKGRLYPMRCDISQENEVKAMFEEIKRKQGRIDICINNAGIALPALLSHVGVEDWWHVMQVNVLGMLHCTQEALKLMKEKEIDDGMIIQMGSAIGQKIPSVWRDPLDPEFDIFNASKFMNRSLSESLRQELKLRNSRIRVSMISPGAVETYMLESALGYENAAFLLDSAECLHPEDIAKAVVYVLQAPPHVNVDDVFLQPADYPQMEQVFKIVNHWNAMHIASNKPGSK